jgi:hypothetical protein
MVNCTVLNSYLCLVYTIVNWKKPAPWMLLTTLEHNQHDVIDVIWRLPVWNVKIRFYLSSCMLQMSGYDKGRCWPYLRNCLYIAWQKSGADPKNVPLNKISSQKIVDVKIQPLIAII